MHPGESNTASPASRVNFPEGPRLTISVTRAPERNDITISQQGGALITLPAGVNLADVVKALNALGATPMDLLAILQAMKSAGALHAEIEVI